jgi:hypothetical protein
MPQPYQTGVNVLAIDTFRMGVVIRGIASLYPRSTPRSPVLAGAFPLAPMQREIDDIELLLLALAIDMEEELAAMLNA